MPTTEKSIIFGKIIYLFRCILCEIKEWPIINIYLEILGKHSYFYITSIYILLRKIFFQRKEIKKNNIVNFLLLSCQVVLSPVFFFFFSYSVYNPVNVVEMVCCMFAGLQVSLLHSWVWLVISGDKRCCCCCSVWFETTRPMLVRMRWWCWVQIYVL